MTNNTNDDLAKIVKDKAFVNCNQKWELDELLKQGYSLEAIKSCCKKDLGNNPRDKFNECLKEFSNRPSFKL